MRADSEHANGEQQRKKSEGCAKGAEEEKEEEEEKEDAEDVAERGANFHQQQETKLHKQDWQKHKHWQDHG